MTGKLCLYLYILIGQQLVPNNMVAMAVMVKNNMCDCYCANNARVTDSEATQLVCLCVLFLIYIFHHNIAEDP